MSPDIPNVQTQTNQPRDRRDRPAAGDVITESMLKFITDALNGRHGSSNPPRQITR